MSRYVDQMKKDLYRALWDLPLSADKIAEALRALGIKGSRTKSCQCPLANYLTKKIGHRVAVGVGRARLVDVQESEQGLPQAALAFVLNFDTGCYSDLDEDNA